MVNPNYVANNSLAAKSVLKGEGESITIPMSEYKTLISESLMLGIVKNFFIKKKDTYGVIHDIGIILGVEEEK